DESGEHERALPGAGWPDHREEGRCLQEGDQVLDLMLTPEERLRFVLLVCAHAGVGAGDFLWTGNRLIEEFPKLRDEGVLILRVAEIEPDQRAQLQTEPVVRDLKLDWDEPPRLP